jgi:hypothetical protein
MPAAATMTTRRQARRRLDAFAAEVIAGFIDRKPSVSIYGNKRDTLDFELLSLTSFTSPSKPLWRGPG